MSSTVHGVELWLLLPSTPDEIEVRCGKEAVLVTRPDVEAEDGPSTTATASL